MKNYRIAPFAIASLFIFYACGSSKNSTQKTDRPNIIFIMTDDHAREAVSAYSNRIMQTPNIDRIGRDGATFTNAFVTNSICGPSRAVFLTGKFSHINGFKDNFDEFDGSQPTLAKYLQASGYYTSVIGKWHLKSKPEGFDYYNILIDQGEYYNPRFYDGNDTIIINGYATNLISDMAIEQLKAAKKSGKPVFMMVHQKAPHRNWMPDTSILNKGTEKVYEMPETFWDDYKTRSNAAHLQDLRISNMFLGNDLKIYLRNGMEEETGSGGEKIGKRSWNWFQNGLKRMNAAQRAIWDKYYLPITEAYYKNKPIGDSLTAWKFQRYMNDYVKTVQSVDDNVGKLLDYLKASGLEENTLIIYTSDQGFFMGEHGWYDKRFMYEPSLTIPLLMRYPGKISAGIKIPSLVQNLDLAPTILTVAGVNVPADMQGQMLNKLLSGENIDPFRKSIYYHYYESTGSHTVHKHFGVRTNRYKLMYFYGLNEWEMFDLETDPDEMKNIYGQAAHAATEATLKKELKRLITQYKDSTSISF